MAQVVLVAGAAFALTRAVDAAHRRGRLPGGSGRWARTNHVGHEVTLVEGVAVSVGAALPLAAVDPAGTVAVVVPAVAGGFDDLVGDTGTKGLRGHLGALARGRVTSGGLKILALAGSGLVATALCDRQTGRPLGLSTITGGAVVAGGANLANLLDLRPGRALKVVLAHSIPLMLAGSPRAAAATGAAAAALPDDLAGRSMLGDTGANPLGALVALAAVERLGPLGRATVLAAVAGLTLASERVSFTRVIAETPWLDAVDRWGRPR